MLATATEAPAFSDRTAAKWLARWRAEGEEVLHGRSSAPSRRPTRLPANGLDKAPEDAGIKLDCITADIPGASGRPMLAALIEGSADPEVLANFARDRLRVKFPASRRLLGGRFDHLHAVSIEAILRHIDFLEHLASWTARCQAMTARPASVARARRGGGHRARASRIRQAPGRRFPNGNAVRSSGLPPMSSCAGRFRRGGLRAVRSSATASPSSLMRTVAGGPRSASLGSVALPDSPHSELKVDCELGLMRQQKRKNGESRASGVGLVF